MKHMWQQDSANIPEVLVVIGAHRDELAFGEAVCAQLDPQQFSILRIPQGISGERPRPDQLEDFRQRHHELYLQILDYVEPGQRMLIDLHHGVDTGTPSADILSVDQALLECACAPIESLQSEFQPEVRGIRLVPDTATMALEVNAEPPPLVARPEIPEIVWNRTDFLYVGVEIYLTNGAPGSTEEQLFSSMLLNKIAGCESDY